MVEAGSAAVRERAEELASTLPPLQIAAERVAATVAQGVHGRRRVGQGEAFWQFRRFQPGDSRQRIDWRQSAKTEYILLRETEWEAAQSVWLWRDGSPSMRYRSSTELPTKMERCDLLAIALMALLVRGGERIALLGDGSLPSTGRTTFNRLTMTLLSGEAPSPSLPPILPLPRFASMLLMGDFLMPLEDINTVIRGYAARGVHGHVVHVLDPAEVTMPFRGRSRFSGLEAEGDLLVGRAEGLRSAYLERLHDHTEALMELTRAIGWGLTIHHTDRPPQPAILALYQALADFIEF